MSWRQGHRAGYQTVCARRAIPRSNRGVGPALRPRDRLRGRGTCSRHHRSSMRSKCARRGDVCRAKLSIGFRPLARRPDRRWTQRVLLVAGNRPSRENIGTSRAGVGSRYQRYHFCRVAASAIPDRRASPEKLMIERTASPPIPSGAPPASFLLTALCQSAANCESTERFDQDGRTIGQSTMPVDLG